MQFWRVLGNIGGYDGSFFHRSQTTSRTVRSCCQACWRCTSKSDPSDLLRSTRRCPAMFRLEACPRPTSYHLDSADLPRHGSYGDRRPAAGRRPIVLATNRNGGKLRLDTSRAGMKEGRVTTTKIRSKVKKLRIKIYVKYTLEINQSSGLRYYIEFCIASSSSLVARQFKVLVE